MGEDAVAEALYAVPVRAAVPDLLGEADDVAAVALDAAAAADPEHGQDPAHDDTLYAQYHTENKINVVSRFDGEINNDEYGHSVFA